MIDEKRHVISFGPDGYLKTFQSGGEAHKYADIVPKCEFILNLSSAYSLM